MADLGRALFILGGSLLVEVDVDCHQDVHCIESTCTHLAHYGGGLGWLLLVLAEQTVQFNAEMRPFRLLQQSTIGQGLLLGLGVVVLEEGVVSRDQHLPNFGVRLLHALFK